MKDITYCGVCDEEVDDFEAHELTAKHKKNCEGIDVLEQGLCGVCKELVKDWDAHEKTEKHKKNCREALLHMANNEPAPDMKRVLMELAYEK